MADAPAPRKRPNWLWIVILALLALLALLWIFGAFGGNTDAEPDLAEAVGVEDAGTEVYEPAVTGDMDTTTGAATGEIDVTGAETDPATLATLPDMVGETIAYSNLLVNRVIGDEAFTIGTGSSETLVRFDEKRTPNTAMEGNVDVNPGATVSMRGEVRSLSDDTDLPASVRNDLSAGRGVYIWATDVRWPREVTIDRQP
ncbi:hypothetical protein [Croceicoccus hydrothermalis]|uniref:hypothetical protein n=1 Tax=Croceicoccus hydrothermalis TaxID=2867964 RepID=UPI001EFAAC4B|nr:hypothetical protein [Croceicoccus hydrothermalis]